MDSYLLALPTYWFAYILHIDLPTYWFVQFSIAQKKLSLNLEYRFLILEKKCKTKENLAEKAEKVAEAVLRRTLHITCFTCGMEYH